MPPSPARSRRLSCALALVLLGLCRCSSDGSRSTSGAGGAATGGSAGSDSTTGGASTAGSAGRANTAGNGTGGSAVVGAGGSGGVSSEAGTANEAGAAGDASDDTDIWWTPTDVTLARTPPMGWNSWNAFHCNYDAADIEGVADALVASGMKDAGYEFVNIDDCWADHRDANGAIVPSGTFPDGMKAVVDYVHGKGLKAGIYTTVGDSTCAGRPGSRNHTAQDANTYASWGVDYAKIDWCGVQGDPASNWREWQTALAGSGRPITFSICTAGRFDPWNWASEVGNLWRTTDDINPNWSWILQILDQNQPLASLAKPGAWNDPDMLEVGNGSNADQIVSDAQNKTHFGLWAMMAAPLIAGNDLRKLTDAQKAVLTNREVIAVDQDPLGYQGYRVSTTGKLEVWVKPLQGNGARAVALFNRGTAAADISVNWTQIGLAAGEATVRDLWAKKDLGTFTNTFHVSVDPQATAMLRVSGAPPKAPQGKAYLSDLQASYASNFWGPVERDQSNGEQAAGDGHPLTIAGVEFTKGLGTHAGSAIRYRLAQRCQSFSTRVGIDDEVTGTGSVRFRIYADGALLADSGVLHTGDAAKLLTVSVTGKNELKLLVDNAEDGNDFDHADWADAQLTCAP